MDRLGFNRNKSDEITFDDNIDDLLNDADLMREFKELGGDHIDFTVRSLHPASPLSPTSPPQAKSVVNSRSQGNSLPPPPHHKLPSLAALEDDDPENCTLTDEDINDPELLSMYKDLGGVDCDIAAPEIESTSKVKDVIPIEHTVEVKTSKSSEQKVPILKRQPSWNPKALTMTVAEAKAMALQKKSEGNIDEALMYMRYIKGLEASSSAGASSSNKKDTATIPSRSDHSLANEGSKATIMKEATKPIRTPNPNPAPKTHKEGAPMNTIAVSTQKQASTTSNHPSSSPLMSPPSTTKSATPPSSSLSLQSQSAATKLKSTPPPPHQPQVNINESQELSSPSSSFARLKIALQEAKDASNAAAQKLNKEGAPKEDIKKKVDEWKKYKQELDVLLSREGVPGARCALFHWAEVNRESVVENRDIGDDQVKLIISDASNMGAVLSSNSGCNVTLDYNLGFPKDNPITGKITGKSTKEGVTFGSTTLISAGLKRNKTTVRHFAKLTASFSMTLHRYLGFSTVPLGVAILPLSALLTKCDCSGIVPLQEQNGDEGTKKAKFVPGALNITLQLRMPIGSPEVEVTNERVLVVGPWPDIVEVQQSPAAPIPSSTPSIANMNTESASHVTATPTSVSTSALPPPPTTKETVNSSQLSYDFSILLEKEKNDPLHIEWLCSNDVLTSELEEAQNAENNFQANPGDNSLDTTLRKEKLVLYRMQVELKLNKLVQRVSDESLTLVEYMEIIRNRCERDKVLHAYLRSLGSKIDSSIVAKVAKRVEIMENEIKGVEEMDAGENDEVA